MPPACTDFYRHLQQDLPLTKGLAPRSLICSLEEPRHDQRAECCPFTEVGRERKHHKTWDLVCITHSLSSASGTEKVLKKYLLEYLLDNLIKLREVK